jgi:hypothetical protein
MGFWSSLPVVPQPVREGLGDGLSGPDQLAGLFRRVLPQELAEPRSKLTLTVRYCGCPLAPVRLSFFPSARQVMVSVSWVRSQSTTSGSVAPALAVGSWSSMLRRVTVYVPPNGANASRKAPNTFHDLRHYNASYLIASGADIKTVQTRLRHASAKTTLDIYGHLMPDADDSSREAMPAIIGPRVRAIESTA